MFFKETITKWESHRDSRGRVPTTDRLGRYFILNSDRISHLTEITGGCRFHFIDNPYDIRENYSNVESSTSFATFKTYLEPSHSSKFITLTVYRENKVNRSTYDIDVLTDDISFAWSYNADPDNYSWVYYRGDRGGMVRILCDLSLDSLLDVLTTTTTTLLATTTIVIPDAPVGLYVVSVTESTVNLIWLGENSNNYRIYYNESGGAFSEYGTTTDMNIEITGLSESTTYQFYVVAYNDDGESDPSDTVTAVTTSSSLIAGWSMDDPVGSDYFANNIDEYATQIINGDAAVYFNGKTYIVYKGELGASYAVSYNHATRTWATPVKIGDLNFDWSKDQLHGMPGLRIDSDGYLHVMYGCHNTDIKYAKSTNPEDISAWTDQPSPGNGSYAQQIMLDNGTLYMFYRSLAPGALAKWSYKTSSDNGINWSAATEVIYDYAYCYFTKGSGNTIHCSMNGMNTTQLFRFNLYYTYFDGTNWKDNSGNNLTLPISDADATNILVRDSGTNYIPQTIVDYDENNTPYILFTEGETADQVSVYNYKIAIKSGSSWNIYSLGAAADHFNDTPSGLDVIDSSNIDAYVIEGGTSNITGGHIKLYKSTNGGQTWALDSTIVAANSYQPRIVLNYIERAKVFIPRYAATGGFDSNEGYLWGDEGIIKNTANPIGVYDSKHLYDATFVGTPVLESGWKNNGIKLEGSPEHLVVLDNNVFSFDVGTPDHAFTVAFAMKATDTSTTTRLLCKGYASHREWEVYIASNVLRFQCTHQNGTTLIYASIGYTSTDWNHLIWTYDGSGHENGFNIYLNNAAPSTTRGHSGTYTGMVNDNGNLFIGCYAGASGYFVGMIDEIRIFDKVLSETERGYVYGKVAGW